MIDRAVETCIAYAADAERPFQQAAEILVVLRRSPAWSEGELTQVQTAVLTELIKRAWARDRSQG